MQGCDVCSGSGAQVLLPPTEGLLGSVVLARIVAASRWSVTGKVVPAEPLLIMPSQEEARLDLSSRAHDASDVCKPARGGVEQASTTSAAGGAAYQSAGQDMADGRIGDAACSGVYALLPDPSTDSASILRNTPNTAFREDDNGAERTEGISYATAAAATAQQQHTSMVAQATMRRPSVDNAANARDAVSSAVVAVASAAGRSAMSACSSAAAFAVYVFQQAVRFVTDLQGSISHSALRTTDDKQDLIDTVLAMGVVLGLSGVLAVCAFDVLDSSLR